jgi:hypothetical protein
MWENDATIQFRGSPTELEGLIPLAFQDVVSSGIPLLYLNQSKSEEDAAPVTVQAESAGRTATILRISLPETPPGKYQATCEIGKERYYCSIEVETEMLLIASPTHLRLQGAPGSTVSADITIVNSGNVSVDIPSRLKLGLLDLKGPERAFGLALAERGKDGLTRINRFVDELAASHSGQISLTVEEGAGTFDPGQIRRLRISLTIPERLKGDRLYSGTLMLFNLAYYIEILVTDKTVSPGEDYEHNLNAPPS